jgi:hypothetical protein
MDYKFKAQTVYGDWVEGYLSKAQGLQHIEYGFYISNSVGMPWAYKVKPETITSKLIEENEKLKKVVEAAMNFKKRVDHSESRQFAADFGEYKHLEQALKELEEKNL